MRKIYNPVKPTKMKDKHIKAIMFSKLDLQAFLSNNVTLYTGIQTFLDSNSIEYSTLHISHYVKSYLF